MSEPKEPDFESGGVSDLNLAEVPRELAILPLRDTILFPHAILPLAVARESSVALVHDAVRERKVIGVVTQRDPAVDDPVDSDLFRIGTLTHIHKMFKFPDGSLRLVVQGVQRFKLVQVHQYRPFLKASIELLQDVVPGEQEVEVKALAQSAMGLFQRVVELSPTLSDELSALAGNIQEPGRLADFVAASLPSLKRFVRPTVKASNRATITWPRLRPRWTKYPWDKPSAGLPPPPSHPTYANCAGFAGLGLGSVRSVSLSQPVAVAP